MDFSKPNVATQKQIKIENHLPGIGKDVIIGNILEGITSSPRRISSMFFYDAAGSKLFEQITRLPEYYPTRTEKQLLRRVAADYKQTVHDMDIVELGSGDCSKISILFEQLDQFSLQTLRYIPVDVSQSAVEESAHALIDRFPGLTIHGCVADFLSQLCQLPRGTKRLFCFLGSTIGNLTQTQQGLFFGELGEIMQADDLLLLGIDMVKDKHIIERAYNDRYGITAAFNRNILKVVNSLAQTNFESDFFEHVAFFNEEYSRIEMHLRATKDMEVTCPYLPHVIEISQDELIHTEYSHKFTIEQISNRLEQSGLKVENVTTDESNWFSVVHITKKRCHDRKVSI